MSHAPRTVKFANIETQWWSSTVTARDRRRDYIIAFVCHQLYKEALDCEIPASQMQQVNSCPIQIYLRIEELL